MKIMVFVSILGAAACYPAGAGKPAAKSARQRAQESIRDHQLSASTFTSHEDYYDDVSDEAEHYHGEEDSAEFGADEPTAYSNSKSADGNGDGPKWTGPQALPPGYHQDGSPHPVQDLPEVVAERQKHLHLYSFGPHAGAVAAANNGQNPVPGGFSSPWVPIIVPLANNYQQYQPVQQLHHPLQF